MAIYTPERQAVYNIARKMAEMQEESPPDIKNSVENWYVTGRSVVGVLHDMAIEAKIRGEPLDGLLAIISPYDLDTLYTMAGHATLVFMEAEKRGDKITADPDTITSLFDSWAIRNGWLAKTN